MNYEVYTTSILIQIPIFQSFVEKSDCLCNMHMAVIAPDMLQGWVAMVDL